MIRPTVLIVRDGWGENPHPEHDAFNAVKLAQTPIADALDVWPSQLIHTSGEDVGLPPGVMGNSEVGHQNIGAGRIVDQDAMRITRAIADGSFFERPAFLDAFAHARSGDRRLHLLGLLSDGFVHSDIEHLLALLEMAHRLGFPPDRLMIHVITDGRDVGPNTGLGYLERLEADLDASPVGRIATVCGRFYAMDRDHRWDRVAAAYGCLTGQGSGRSEVRQTTSAHEAFQIYYDHPSSPSQHGDEFILPTQVTDDTGNPIGLVRPGDAVIFCNFRGDRPREISKAFILDDAAWAEVKNDGFDRGPRIDDLHFATMAMYEQGLPVSGVAFDKPGHLPNILGQVVAERGLTQFRSAETEKFPHVTFFFNDYREAPFEGERRELIPSPTEVTTYDQKPQMSAAAVTDAVVRRLESEDCESLLIVNFANADMVGHTGNLAAAVRAVEVVDECVGRILEALLARDGAAIVTADHGNAEQMWNPEANCPHTAHTTYEVPLVVVGERYRGAELRSGGRLADVAPTLLAIMGEEQPEAMTGAPLI